jgi:hypothetical protein
MSSNLMGELVANNGTYFLSSGTYTGNIDQVIVRGNGINGIAIYINEVEVTLDYLYNGDETLLPDGLRITPKGDAVFTSIEIYGNNGIENGTGLELVLA